MLVGRSPRTVQERLPMANPKDNQALIPISALIATRPAARTPKPGRVRGLLAPRPGNRLPKAWPGQPGPYLRERGPSYGPPGADSGPRGRTLGTPLAIAEVAELIGCSPWTVRQTLIPRGLPHFRFKANGRLIFYRDQVIRWIENQQGGQQ